jgi:hypothetical protein
MQRNGRTFVAVIATVMLVLIALVPVTVDRYAHAASVAAPAVLARSFVGTATDTATSVTIESTSGQKRGATVSVNVCNDDDPTEVGGGETVWINFAGAAADPGTTFTQSDTIPVLPGTNMNIDGQFLRFSIRVNNAGQTAPVRIIASF